LRRRWFLGGWWRERVALPTAFCLGAGRGGTHSDVAGHPVRRGALAFADLPAVGRLQQIAAATDIRSNDPAPAIGPAPADDPASGFYPATDRDRAHRAEIQRSSAFSRRAVASE
jgi:hypothetical protein